MKHTKTLMLLLAVLLVAAAGQAQVTDDQTVTLTVSEIAEIAVSGNISMTISGTGTAGTQPTDPTDSSSTLQYTSTVDGTNVRAITAEISAGSVPSGTSLDLDASSFGANEGSSAGPITLSGTAANLITGIGSVATGATGPTLDYTWSIDDMTALVIGTDPVTVTFTLLDDGPAA